MIRVDFFFPKHLSQIHVYKLRKKFNLHNMYINVHKIMYMIKGKKNISKCLLYYSHGKDEGINID
jgi:hypothetical protein